MKKILLLFLASFVVTAVFSASLKIFFQEVSWREVLIKGLLIPCFTWTIQLLLSAAFLKSDDRLTYWNRLGWVCLIGSIALLPAAFYNLSSPAPWVWISILNVLASVVLMAVTLHFLLRRAGFHWLWTLSWAVLIVINMSLYLYSVLAKHT
jgi:hypothetical protein